MAGAFGRKGVVHGPVHKNDIQRGGGGRGIGDPAEQLCMHHRALPEHREVGEDPSVARNAHEHRPRWRSERPDGGKKPFRLL